MEAWEDGKPRNHPHPNIGIRTALIKEVYRLHKEEFLSYRDIADECDISVATVSKYIKEAAGDDLPIDAAQERARLYNLYNTLIKEIRTSMLAGDKGEDGWREDVKLMLATVKDLMRLLQLDKVGIELSGSVEAKVDVELEDLVMQFDEAQDIRNTARARNRSTGRDVL